MFFILIFFVPYLFFLYPTVSVGDSGELITAAYTLGIPHPPGYPLWTILGKIFTLLIPFGNIAYRVNLMSAFFGALTCVILYLIVSSKQLAVSKENQTPPSLTHLLTYSLSALALAFSKTFWSQSIISEVYTLNAFFVVLIIYLLLTTRYLQLAIFVYGLSLANHYIMFLFGPIFAFYLIWKNPKVFNLKTILTLLIFFLPGLFLYLYLPIRSSVNPPIDWGNPENLKNFTAHIGRFQYRGLELAAKVGFATKLLFIRNFFSQLVQNFGLFVVLSVFGLVSLIKKDIKFALLTVFIFLANTVGLIILLNFKFTPQDIDAFTPYYIPAWIMMATWTGYEIGRLAKFKYILALFFLVLGFHLFLQLRTNHNRYNFTAYDYPVNVLKTVARNGVLYLHDEVDETIFTLSYLKNVVNKRQDVTIIDSYNNIFLSKNVPEKSKIYYSAVNTAKVKKSLHPVRSGTSCYDTSNGVYLNGLLWTERKKSDKLIWDFYVKRDLLKKYEYREQEVIARYSYFYGKFLIDSGDKKDGIFALKKSLKVGPELIWLHNNVGDILRQRKDFSGAFGTLSHTILLDSTYSPAYYNMGLLYLAKEDWGGAEKAIDYFKKAYQYDKMDLDSLIQLSKIYQRKGYENFVGGKIDDAITEYKKAIEYTPSSADIYYNVGVIYSQSQNNKEAKEYFQKYIQLKPGGPNAETIKKWLASN
ncbi:MAG: DUF2723 domain-containing protein [Elusimicrobia bacterium]|nr:DUF2723 domain-containing protein [Elusimicrobiota bacterium]